MSSFKKIVQKIIPEHFNQTAFSLSKDNMGLLNNVKHNIMSQLQLVRQDEVVQTKRSIPTTDLEGNVYFDASIIDEIQRKYTHTVVFEYHDTIHIKLLFHFLSNSGKHNLEKYKDIMLSWLLLLKRYETPSCVKTVEVDMYLTQFKKKLKESTSNYRGGSKQDVLVPLGGYNVNTGFTQRCAKYNKGNGNIVLYREEDLLKVFFHESMHLFNMEFHDTGEYSARKIIRIDSDINIFESYCETWARLINILYYSIYYPNKDLQLLMIAEALYSLKQAIKVLNYYRLSVEDIHDNIEKVGTQFTEKSNVYSYYIVTAMLLTHPDNFLTFCRTFNVNTLKFNKKHLNKYIHLLESILKSRNIISIKDKFNSAFESEYRQANTSEANSLKMSFYSVM